jgi:nitroimidazol reductase NimA-like FMN-containing flavoprotein (pyridoxamine 5'-phosphate oxidase superfamily)
MDAGEVGSMKLRTVERANTEIHLEEISAPECLELLRTEEVGRLGVVVRGRPEIFPVNYALDQSGSVILRTAVGTKLSAAVNHHVALEVDRFDSDMRIGWSVVVHGVAHHTGRVVEGDHALTPWRSDAPYLVRISHLSVTGRRIG